MSYASRFMNARQTDTPAAPAFGGGNQYSNNTAFSGGRDQPQTNSSLFGNRRPQRPQTQTIDESAVASNPWAARAAAANGVKVEEKLNFESEKQFPTLGAAAPAPKKGAWGNSTVTAAALAADWAAKDAEERAAAEAEKLRREAEAAHLAEQRRQYTTFTPSRSDVFRHEVYNNSYDEDDYADDGYPDDSYAHEELPPMDRPEEEEWTHTKY